VKKTPIYQIQKFKTIIMYLMNQKYLTNIMYRSRKIRGDCHFLPFLIVQKSFLIKLSPTISLSNNNSKVMNKKMVKLGMWVVLNSIGKRNQIMMITAMMILLMNWFLKKRNPQITYNPHPMMATSITNTSQKWPIKISWQLHLPLWQSLAV